MTYPNDFQLIHPKIGQGEDTIDSFSLLTSILNDLTQHALNFQLSNSLPVIIGDFDTIRDCLRDFVLQTISNFSEYTGTYYILFREDLESSFLSYFIEGSEKPKILEEKNQLADLVDVIHEFRLGICLGNQTEHKEIEWVSETK